MTKERLFQILEAAKPGDHASRKFDIFILSIIGVNAVAVVLESVESVYTAAPNAFIWIEAISGG